MKKKKWVLYLMAAVMLLAGTPAAAQAAQEEEIPAELSNLYARSAVLLDADSGRVLFGKDEDIVRPMASTTKIMTCILALENGMPDDVAEASDNAARQPQVRLGVKAGDTFRLEDLLYSLMLESHNDSAVLIAEQIGGSVEQFAKMMNQKADELGCRDTHFVSPNGLDAEDEEGVHSTTARDLAVIMKYCIKESPKKEEFLKITRTSSYTFTDTSGSRSFSAQNHNAFLTMMDGALSGKTGFTADAGYCYVGALERDGKTLIVALLACGWPNNKGYKWKDTTKLMEYGLKHYTYKNVWKEIKPGKAEVKNGIDEKDVYQTHVTVPLEIQEPDEEFQILLGDHENVDVTWEIDKALEAPVKKGEKAGTITYRLEGDVLRTYDVVTSGASEKRNIRFCFRVILNRFIGG